MGLPSDPMFIVANIVDSAVAGHQQCPPVRDMLGDDTEYAYASARVRLERRVSDGATLIGRKIGLTNQPVRDLFHAREPSWGPLFADMLLEGQLDLAHTLQPKIEAEVALVLGADITTPNPSYTVVRDAVSHAAAAFELVDSRIADWDLHAVDHIVDFASSLRFALGSRFVSLDELNPRDVSVDLYFDGVPVATGDGSNVYGDPVASLQWLAATSVAQHRPLRAGDVVLTGSMIPPRPLDGVGHYRGDFLGLGELELEVIDSRPKR